MAHGRPDYWQSSVLGLPSPMGGQSLFTMFEEADIAAGDTLDMVAYANPADRILYVSSILISTNSRCLNQMRVSIAGAWRDLLYFVTYLPVPWHPSAFYEILQSQAIFVRVYNYDIYERHFSCTLLGYEELG